MSDESLTGADATGGDALTSPLSFVVPESAVLRGLQAFAGVGAATPAGPEAAALYAAQARLVNVRADREERALAREIAAESMAAPCDLAEVLPGRFDLVVIGPRGSGKTRALAELRAMAERSGVPVTATIASWPKWDRVGGHIVLVDEAGVLLEGAERARDVPEELRATLALARHRNVCVVLVAQHTSQVPVAVLRHGVGLLVTAAPWMWRVLAREDLRDRLDAANDVIAAAPGSMAYVDPHGRARAVRIES